MSKYKDAVVNIDDVRKEKQERVSAKDRATQLLLDDGAVLFHDSMREHYITINQDGKPATYFLKSSIAKDYLALLYYEATGRGLTETAAKEAMATLKAIASSGDPVEVHQRIARDGEDILFYLGDKNRNVARITKNGWELEQVGEVRFLHSDTLKPLPLPDKDGDIELFRKLIDLPEKEWVLLRAYLVQLLIPSREYPVVAITGSQGSAKTTLTDTIKTLVDNQSPLQRAIPDNDKDLIIFAANTHVMAFDNISAINNQLSDTLCRISTKSGVGYRKLYSDREEMVFEITRPILLNGIGDIARRPDLLDRTITINLPSIKPDKRISKDDYWDHFNELHPQLLGGLLNLLVLVLNHHPHVEMNRIPRMTIFAKIGTAVDHALDLEEGKFVQCYEDDQAAALEIAFESDALCKTIQELMMLKGGHYAGTPTALMKQLNQLVENPPRDWPVLRNLRNKLERLKPVLEHEGIDYSFKRQAGTGEKTIILESLNS